MKSKPRVLIVNYHSLHNSGDAAIVLGMVALLRRSHPGADLTLTSRTPTGDRCFFRNHGVRVIPPLFHSPAGFRQRWTGLAAAAASLALPYNALRFCWHVLRADLVAVAGGGYFYGLTNRFPGVTFWQNFLHVRLAQWLDKPVVFFPQSFGPFVHAKTRQAIRKLLLHPGTRRVFSRETISRELLAEILGTGKSVLVEFAPDMTFYFPPGEVPATIEPVRPPLPPPRLALALRDWDFPLLSGRDRCEARERYIETMLTAVDLFCRKHDGSVLLFDQVRGPTRSEDDRRFSTRFAPVLAEKLPAGRLRRIVLPPTAPPGTLIRVVADCDLLVASRLHAVIFALLSGTPAMGLGYLPKTRGIMQGLGLERFYLDIGESQVEPLLLRMEEMWRERTQLTEAIRARVSQARREIEDTVGKALQELLDETV